MCVTFVQPYNQLKGAKGIRDLLSRAKVTTGQCSSSDTLFFGATSWCLSREYIYIPWEPTTFIFRGYNPYIGGWKPSFFMVLGSKGNMYTKELIHPKHYAKITSPKSFGSRFLTQHQPGVYHHNYWVYLIMSGYKVDTRIVQMIASSCNFKGVKSF